MPRGTDEERALLAPARPRRRLPRSADQVSRHADLSMTPPEQALEDARSLALAVRRDTRHWERRVNPQALTFISRAARLRVPGETGRAPCVALVADALIERVLGPGDIDDAFDYAAESCFALPLHLRGVATVDRSRRWHLPAGDDPGMTLCGRRSNPVPKGGYPRRAPVSMKYEACRACAKVSTKRAEGPVFPLGAGRSDLLAPAPREQLELRLRETLLEAFVPTGKNHRHDSVHLLSTRRVLEREFTAAAGELIAASLKPAAVELEFRQECPTLFSAVLEPTYPQGVPPVRVDRLAARIRSLPGWIFNFQPTKIRSALIACMIEDIWPEAIPLLRSERRRYGFGTIIDVLNRADDKKVWPFGYTL